MFGLGQFELLIVLGIALLVFGSRIPKLARSLGQAQKEFKAGQTEGSKAESSESSESNGTTKPDA